MGGPRKHPHNTTIQDLRHLLFWLLLARIVPSGWASGGWLVRKGGPVLWRSRRFSLVGLRGGDSGKGMIRACMSLAKRPVEPCKFCEYAAGKSDRDLLYGDSRLAF